MLASATGWTWREIDREMTLPRLQGFTRYWDTIPPLDVAVGAIAQALGLDWKKAKKKNAKVTPATAVADLANVTAAMRRV